LESFLGFKLWERARKRKKRKRKIAVKSISKKRANTANNALC
jgi:hypothetical protein